MEHIYDKECKELLYKYSMKVYEAMDVGIFITDSNCNILAINDYFQSVTTIPREELIGKSVGYLLDKEYISESICHKVIKELNSVTGILRYKNVNKEVIVTGRPIFGDDGKLKLIVCTLRDWNLLTNIYKELRATKVESEQYKEQIQNMTMQQLEDVDFISKDQKTKKMLQMAFRVALGDSSVLLLGESGVGKDVLARFIHKYSPRGKRSGKFVHVNCGAIPESLFEAEFFGYAPGAFTGASKTGKLGLVELADGGTLFLDEVAELPLFMQAKLLTVLQNRTLTRVGDTQEKKVDIKIIAATNKNLEKLVESGGFRQDLYYRLNVFQIFIPSLRDRKDDITPLVALFLEKFNNKYRQNKSIDNDALDALIAYNWPGNVRELENMIERLVVLCTDERIKAEHLPEGLSETLLVSEAVKLSGREPLKSIVERLERAVILHTIMTTDSLKETASQLGLDISTLTRKKQKYGIFKKGEGMHKTGAELHIVESGYKY